MANAVQRILQSLMIVLVMLGVFSFNVVAEATPLQVAVHTSFAPRFSHSMGLQSGSNVSKSLSVTSSVYNGVYDMSASRTTSTSDTNVRDFGASGSSETTGGTIFAGSNTLSLTSPIDFKDGEGIFIPNAGPLSSLVTPPAPTVSVAGGPRGNGTYGYQVVAIDSQNGGSAASSVGLVTNGPPTLGGLGPNASGAGLPIYKASWIGISVTDVPGAHTYAIYRVQVPSGSNLSTGYLGLYTITNTPFLDYGQAVRTPPAGIPATPPSNPFGDSLVTTIVSGAGTTNLVLAQAAATSVSNDRIYHDDTQAFEAALATRPSRLYIPPGTYGISSPITDSTANGVVYGDGSTSLIQFQGNAMATFTLGASGMTLENVGLNGEDITHQLVSISSTQSLNNVTVRNTTGYDSISGICVINENPASPSVVDTNITMTGNSYYNCEYTYNTFGAVNGVNIVKNQANFTDYNYSGRTVSLKNWHFSWGYGYAQNFTVEGNTLYAGNHTAAVVIQGSGIGSITDNELFISGGIFGVSGFGEGQTPSAAGGYTVSGNYIEALWNGTGVAFNLTNQVNVTIDKNNIVGFGYAFEAGGYGAQGGFFPDSPSNHVVISDNSTSQIAFSDVLGTLPQSVTLSGTTSPSNLSTISVAPDAPNEVSHDDLTDTSWTEHWSPVSGASGYNVYVNGTKVNTTPVTGTSYQVTGKIAHSTYSVSVTAVNAGGESELSSPDSVTTNYNASSSPTGLTHTHVTSNGWTESWMPVTGTGIGSVTYAVFLNGHKVGTVDSPTYDFTGVTAGKTYEVTVASINGSGQVSATSSVDNVTTASSSSVPGSSDAPSTGGESNGGPSSPNSVPSGSSSTSSPASPSVSPPSSGASSDSSPSNAGPSYDSSNPLQSVPTSSGGNLPSGGSSSGSVPSSGTSSTASLSVNTSKSSSPPESGSPPVSSSASGAQSVVGPAHTPSSTQNQAPKENHTPITRKPSKPKAAFRVTRAPKTVNSVASNRVWYAFTVTDNAGSMKSDIRVAFRFENKTYVGTTNAHGVVTFRVIMPKRGGVYYWTAVYGAHRVKGETRVVRRPAKANSHASSIAPRRVSIHPLWLSTWL